MNIGVYREKSGRPGKGGSTSQNKEIETVERKLRGDSVQPVHVEKAAQQPV